MGNFGLNGGVPWFTNIDGELCILCKERVEDVSHFLLDCHNFRGNHESLWSNLSQKVTTCNPSDGSQISQFCSNMDREQKILLLLGCSFPFLPGYDHYGEEVNFFCYW